MLGGNSDAQQELLIPGEVKDDCQIFKHNNPTSTFLYGVGTVDRLLRAGVLELFSAQTRLGLGPFAEPPKTPVPSSASHGETVVLLSERQRALLSCFWDHGCKSAQCQEPDRSGILE